MLRLFISDLHLQEDKAYLTDAFSDFLNTQAKDCDELYILGDLFNYWVADSLMNDYQMQIAQQIKALKATKYFIPGNRDFLIGRKFAKLSGIKILQDESVLTIDGSEVLLCHGDSLCTLDQNYLKFRRFRMNPVNRFIYTLLPAAIKRHLAQKVRRDAYAEKNTKSTEMMDVVDVDFCQLMQRKHCSICIHGHTHKPYVHSYPEMGYKRFVLGDWRTDGYEYLQEQNGKFELQKIRLN